MLIFLKFSEIFTKTERVRKRFLNILKRNIESAFERENFDGKVILKRDRLIVRCAEYRDFFERIFGIRKILVVNEISFGDLNDLKKKVAKLMGDKVKKKTFGVRVKRKGRHKFNSLTAEREIGAELVKKGGKVNLDNPDVWVKLEIEDKKAYLIEKEIDGAGGLPIGTEGEALCLVSGGFDSIIASYFVAKRGTEISFLFFNLGGFSHLKEVTNLLNFFWRKYLYGIFPYLFAVDFRPIVEDIRTSIPKSYWGVILKRKMFEVAEKIAKNRGIKAIVTGEALGQVSSQTLDSLYVIENILQDVICLRPLIGFDKEEIINISRKIGTYEISEKIKEYCAIVPDKPVTKPELKKVEEIELLLEKNLIPLVIKTMRVIKPPYEIEEEDVEIERIPDSAIKVDIRDKLEREILPFESDLKIHYKEIDNYEFDKNKTYIFFCNYGLFSQEVALKLREKGIKAYAYSGGILRYNKKCSRNL